MTVQCPSCQSDHLRRSRHRPEDGLWRSLFYTAYRCRDCGRRFQRLTSGLLLGVTVTALACAIFGAGFALGGLNGITPPQTVTFTSSAPTMPESADDDGGGTTMPASGDLALAAAAEEGDAKSQLRLGVAYLKGQGVEADSTLAVKWIQRAAEQGYADAQYALGAMYNAGRGALQSFPLAVKWFEKAAQQNHAEAQYSLGMMYRSGQGVPVDKSKAYIWFNLSAAQGHERAREARDNILPALTPDQVLAAQKAAQEWRPTVAKK